MAVCHYPAAHSSIIFSCAHGGSQQGLQMPASWAAASSHVSQFCSMGYKQSVVWQLFSKRLAYDLCPPFLTPSGNVCSLRACLRRPANMNGGMKAMRIKWEGRSVTVKCTVLNYTPES